MSALKDLFNSLLILAFIIQVSSWVILFILNSRQGKIEDKMRSEVTQPEYYLLKWDSNPKWAAIEKFKQKIFFAILSTGAFLLLIGFIANGINNDGECYNRFEDYCTGFE